jgi:cytoskeleton protein RodZ
MSESVGTELKQAREARGLSVGDVAQQLKFAPRQLEALEEDRFDLLPGGTFARGMVRSYARLLKLEAEPLVERMNGRFQAPDANTLAARYSQPVPFSDSGRRSTFVYLGLSLGILAIGSGIGYQWYREHSAPAQAAAKRPQQVVVATAPPATSAPKPAVRAQPKVVETSAPMEIASVSPKPAVQMTAAAPKAVEPAAQKAAEKPAEKPAPKVLTGGVNRLVIVCEEESWIEVKDANDRMLVSSLNPRGAERVVQSRGPLSLVIGNPANVRVMHNNKRVDLAPHTKLGISRFTLQ